MISLEKWIILTPLQKLPKNGEDLGKSLLPKCNKSPNLVTLVVVAKWSACSPSTLTIRVEQFVFEKNENKQNNDWAHFLKKTGV